MKKIRGRFFTLDEALKHPDHRAPLTRREFIAQGFMKGGAAMVGGSLIPLLANPRKAYAALTQQTIDDCDIKSEGASKIPFICFDLAGGANIAGSNVLVGQGKGQLDFLTTAGYSKLGIPGNMIPSKGAPSGVASFFDQSMGLAFHSDSAFFRGIVSKTSQATRDFTNGAVIPAISENDTANNPHNPMYAIHKAGTGGAGADGSLVTLIGSRASDSGGNSMAPMDLFYDPSVRPTKIDRPSDVKGLVPVGDLVRLLAQNDVVAVTESILDLSDKKLEQIDSLLTSDIKNSVHCSYVKSAYLADKYGNPGFIDPEADAFINAIFSAQQLAADDEYRKTASIMKMVVEGFAGAGTITMGGFDYHTGDRSTGEMRDFRAGECMGACLEYAARKGKPIMIYVFSDGSVASNGMIDTSPAGRNKGVWTGDNSSTAASFFLVYNPSGRPQTRVSQDILQMGYQGYQLGYMRGDGSVETAATPASNNVNLLVQTVALNYMALHGEQANFASAFPNHGLGPDSLRDSLTAFNPIVNGTIGG